MFGGRAGSAPGRGVAETLDARDGRDRMQARVAGGRAPKSRAADSAGSTPGNRELPARAVGGVRGEEGLLTGL